MPHKSFPPSFPEELNPFWRTRSIRRRILGRGLLGLPMVFNDRDRSISIREIAGYRWGNVDPFSLGSRSY
jgi:hypothetical protein